MYSLLLLSVFVCSKLSFFYLILWVWTDAIIALESRDFVVCLCISNKNIKRHCSIAIIRWKQSVHTYYKKLFLFISQTSSVLLRNNTSFFILFLRSFINLQSIYVIHFFFFCLTLLNSFAVSLVIFVSLNHFIWKKIVICLLLITSIFILYVRILHICIIEKDSYII